MPRTKKPKIESISEDPVVIVNNNLLEKQPKSKKEKVPTTKPKAHGKLVKGSDESFSRMKELREIKAQKRAQKN